MRKYLLLMLMTLLPAMIWAADANYCIKFSTTSAHANAWDDQGSYTLNNAMTKGRNYTLTMKVKATGKCNLALWPIDTQSTNRNEWGNSADVQYLASYSISTEWKTYTWSFNALFPLDRLDFVFGGLNGSIFFDDIKLVDDEVGVNMVTNGDFAENSTKGWSTASGYNGTTFTIVDSDSGNVAPEPDEPVIPDTWELAEQGDPNFQIYLCFGQSNMEGATQPEAIDYENVPERFKMMAAVNYNTPKRTMGEWYTATPALCRQGTGLSPADYFGRTMVENLPEEVSVGVINVAVGGAKIELFMQEKKDAYINGEAQWFRDVCQQYDNDPLGRLIEMGKKAQEKGVIKGILLHQGESNNGESTWCTKVAKVYKRICYYLGLNPEEVPLLAGETRYENMGGGCSWHNVAALPNLKKTVPNSYVIKANGIEGVSSDPWHFSAKGYREFGKRYAQQMLQILDATNGIEDISEEKATDDHVVIYNLNGQRVTDAKPGTICIVNGKKVVI